MTLVIDFGQELKTPGSFFNKVGTVAPGKQRVRALGKWICLTMESPTMSRDGGISGGMVDGVSLFADICGLNGSWLTGEADGLMIGAVFSVVVRLPSMDGTSELEGGWSSEGADGLAIGAIFLMVVWLF